MLFSVQIDTVTAIEPPHIDLTIGHESQPAINPELVKSENYLQRPLHRLAAVGAVFAARLIRLAFGSKDFTGAACQRQPEPMGAVRPASH